MTSVQSFIRDEVNREVFPAPKAAEAFRAYAIASGIGLIPEREKAARQTLEHPMTFEILGEGLRLFDGWALRDLANFRRRCRDNLVSCFGSFLKPEEPVPIWMRCNVYGHYTNESPPPWLAVNFRKHLDESRKAFSSPLFNPRNIRGEYLSVLEDHINSHGCVSCPSGRERICKELEDRLTQAVSKVCTASSVFGEIVGV